jgi:hypothetical protein
VGDLGARDAQSIPGSMEVWPGEVPPSGEAPHLILRYNLFTTCKDDKFTNTSNSSLTISGSIDAGSKEACRMMGVATHQEPIDASIYAASGDVCTSFYSA